MVEFHSRREFFDFSAASMIGVAASPMLSAAARPENNARPPFTSVKDFGALGDGVADDSAAVKRAYDGLKPTGGTLFFPRGRYRLSLELTSRNVHIVGEGRGASVLSPVLPGGTVIRALYREGSWDAVTIADMSLVGVGKNHGNGFAAGGESYNRHDEYTGSTFFSRVQFANFDKCLTRPFGSIGLWIDGCQFGAANYHIWSRGVSGGVDRDVMHAGCVIVSRCHMDYFAKAMLYLDSKDGDCGQIVFENNIFEAGPGFVVYVRNFNSSGGVPGMLFRNNWNENTATASNLEIEGKHHSSARFLYAANAASAIRFEDTPIGPCELVASGLQTDNCSLQNLTSINADAASTVTHERARMFSGTSVGQVRSIAHPPNTEGLRTPWFRMAVPQLTSSPNGQEVLTIGGNQPLVLLDDLPLRSTAIRNSDVPDGGPVQKLSIGPPKNMPLSETVSLKGTGWLVTCYVYKLISGPGVGLQINGTKGVSGLGELSSVDWEMLVNISKFQFASEERVTAYHQSLDQSTLLIGRIALFSFKGLQQATDFINRSFPTS